MKIAKITFFFSLVSSLIGADLALNIFHKDKNYNYNNRNSQFSHIIGIMVDFQPDNDPNTTGQGQFLEQIDISFIDSDEDRCNDFIVDPPPHNRFYFEDQIEAVKNYYVNISNNNFNFNFNVLDNLYTLSKNMKDYSISDATIGELFAETLELAKDDIEETIDMESIDDYLFVIFHAGVGQDISFPYFDPTNYDIPSAYVENSMLSTISDEAWISQHNIDRGIILPETLNHIYYDIIEELFYGVDDYCDYQIGMTGLFALLIGYALDFPPLYNTDNARAGVGVFGLMDYGSNNGYGVIPSLPSPWTRIYNDWETFSYSSFGENILENNIHRIDIATDEYLLIENRNNWVSENVDLDSLRNKNKIWSDSYQDSIIGHFFDVLINNLDSGTQLTIDPETNVILEFDNYDYGLPGSGIVIWEINESMIDENNLSAGINNDSNNKAIQIKEADGSMDIGFECYHWNPAFCDILTRGWEYDMWYDNNESYFINNPEEPLILLNDYTNPNLQSSLGSLSLITLDQFSILGDIMSFEYSNNPWVDEDYISNQEIEIIGSGVINENGCVFYIEENNYYKKCFNEEVENINHLNIELYSNVLIYNNEIHFTNSNSYIDENGIIQNNLDELGIYGYINSTTELEESLEGISLGDLDNDGLDEIIVIDSETLDIKNQNGTSIDNFPIQGNFDNVVLIADILDDGSDSVELILREENSINFINSQGEIIQSIASNNTNNLRLLPNWGENIALIDGNRILLFPYNDDQIFWTSQYGTDWNYPVVNPNSSHQVPEFYLDGEIVDFYNYPNPVRNDGTTFRFLYNMDAMAPKIKIYNIEGTLKETISPNGSFNFQSNEFNEIFVSLADYKSGVYFAELKDGDKSLSFIKVAVIK